MAGLLSLTRVLAVLVLSALLLADGTSAQTFTWTRSWKPGGKRSPSSSAMLAAADADDVPAVYLVDPLREHQAPFAAWRLADGQPLTAPFARQPQSYDQTGDHDDH